LVGDKRRRRPREKEQKLFWDSIDFLAACNFTNFLMEKPRNFKMFRVFSTDQNSKKPLLKLSPEEGKEGE
jgi:hypothetical protein